MNLQNKKFVLEHENVETKNDIILLKIVHPFTQQCHN